MVENESISGSINAHRKYENRRISRSNVRQKEGCGQLYAHYLRREGMRSNLGKIDRVSSRDTLISCSCDQFHERFLNVF